MRKIFQNFLNKDCYKCVFSAVHVVGVDGFGLVRWKIKMKMKLKCKFHHIYATFGKVDF
jgi:hypothetical protein